MLPLVSVVITGKNEKDTIASCIEAVFKQTYPNFEVIYIDACSNDGTFQSALAMHDGWKAYKRCKRYIPISIATSSPGSGRNYGARLSRGSIIAFVDADCVPDARWLENLIRHFSEKIFVVGGPNLLCSSNNSTVGSGAIDVLGTFLGSGGSAQFMNIVRPTQVSALSACNMAIQKDLFYSLGGFDEELRFNEDSDLSYRLRKSGHKMLYSPRAKVDHLKKIGSYRDFSSLMLGYGYQRGRNVARKPWLLARFNILSIICIGVLISLLIIASQNATAQQILIWICSLFLAIIIISSAILTLRKRSLVLILIYPVLYLTIYSIYNYGFLLGMVTGVASGIARRK